MVYFQTKTTNMGKFWSVLQRKMLVYFMDILYILRTFCIFDGHLVCLRTAIWYILRTFCIFDGHLVCLRTAIWYI
jgi:hypothetical protein